MKQFSIREVMGRTEDCRHTNPRAIRNRAQIKRILHKRKRQALHKLDLMDQQAEIRTLLAELAETKQKLRDAEFMDIYINDSTDYADSLRDMDDFLDDMDYQHNHPTSLDKLDEVFDCIEIENQTKKLAEMEIDWEWYENWPISGEMREAA